MRYILFFLFIVGLVIATISCKCTKHSSTADASTPPGTWILKYDRGPCFGSCPVYTLYLLTDHHGLLYAKTNLLPQGWYAASLDQKEVDELLRMLELDKYWHPDLSDQPTISDQPSHHLEYKHPSGLRILDAQSKFNTDLSDLFRKFNHLVEETKWDTSSMRPADFVPQPSLDFIVQLKAGIDPDKWIKKYATYGATVKRKISPSQTYYLISKDPAKGSSDNFYAALKRDQDLIGVQIDSHTENRNKQ